MAKKAKKQTPRPLKKKFAIILTRFFGEYDTRAEADAAEAKIKLKKDELSVIISKKDE